MPAASTVGHYENFPVASLLMPAALRRPVRAIYAFARSADDFADEGQHPQEWRLARLDEYRQALQRLQSGQVADTPLFTELGGAITAYSLPFEAFFDLLDAFSQDVVKGRYADFDEVLDYCRHSANPVGRLMLHLYGAADSRNLAWSDAICTALQLINFWQDVEIDLAKDRIYLPQDDMARHGVTEAQLAARDSSGGFRPLMRFQCERAGAMLDAGAPLATRLPGRIGLELRMIVQGGRRILDKMESAGGDVFRHRPTLSAFDWPLMFFRAFTMRRA